MASSSNTRIKRRVAITGMGAVSASGHSLQESWTAVLEGMVNVGEITVFDASQFPCRFAYEVKNFNLDESKVSATFRPHLNRAAEFAIHAIHEAKDQAGLTKGAIDPLRTAVCLGVGVASPTLKWYNDVFYQNAFARDSLTYFQKRNDPSTLTAVASHLINAKGGNYTIHTACASSGQALGEAYRLVANGLGDVVLTGGADSMINPFQMAGFCSLGALSTRNSDPKRASRPFDADREGFVLGEGAAMLIFEEWEHARMRGAKIIGEICGYGVTESAYRITDLHPEGRGTIEAMSGALNDAGIRPQDIGYLNAHGTSTKLNDRIESLAVQKCFPSCPELIVSSTKSVTGHLISAAGATEFAVCVLALQHQLVPPSVNLIKQDPECAIRVSRTKPEPKQFEYALSNSIGFGGSNTSLIARRVRDE